MNETLRRRLATLKEELLASEVQIREYGQKATEIEGTLTEHVEATELSLEILRCAGRIQVLCERALGKPLAKIPRARPWQFTPKGKKRIEQTGEVKLPTLPDLGFKRCRVHRCNLLLNMSEEKLDARLRHSDGRFRSWADPRMDPRGRKPKKAGVGIDTPQTTAHHDHIPPHR